jgi:BirA family biotin operon repressor/biotin-[acetyl-CoA-carboxylase] ligase
VSPALVLPPAYRLVALDKIDSTNEEAKRLARGGADHLTLVWAQAQSAGKGRGGRTWSSPVGNLYASLVLRPRYPAARAAELGFVTAIALGAALGGKPAYKWPNDVLLDGRKLAGILLETESAAAGALDWLVLGFGVNVVSFPPDSQFPATSLKAAGMAVTAAALLESFAGHFLDWLDRWQSEGFAPVRQAWLARAKGIGDEINVRLPNATLRGTFMDLDGDGALLLGPDRRRITAGDVFFG